MRCVMLHYHIFKNAGSTVEEIFDRSFGAAFSRMETQVSEGLVSNQDILGFLERNAEIKALSSHQIRYPTPKTPGFLFLDVCFLRDPIDRLRSIYDFYHSRPAVGDPLSDLAQGPIGAFLAGLVDQFELYAKNVQVNLLACAGDSDEPEEKDFQIALERIRRAAFLGVVDYCNKSMVAGQYFLQPVFPELDCAQPAENVTGGLEGDLARRIAKVRAACPHSVYAELLRLNALDIRLVDCARAEVDRRFRLVPDACTKLQQFEARILAPPGRRTGGWLRKQEPQPPAQGELGAGQPSRPVQTVSGGPSSENFGGTSGGLFPRKRTPSFPPVWSAGCPAVSASARPGWFTKLRRLARTPLDACFLWLCSRRYGASLFDPQYYSAKYPENGPGTNPLIHFWLRGAFEHKKPHPLFDPAFYLQKYPDVAASGANPLGHYLRRGAAQQRQPIPFFDPAYYLAHNEDVRAARIPPFFHYIRHGAAEGRKPHPLFQAEYYARNCAGTQISAGGLLANFAESGANAASPHPLFDCYSYLTAHPEAAALDINPLAHYLLSEPGKPRERTPEPQPRERCLEVAQFEIDDVPVVVVFQGDGWTQEQERQPGTTVKARETRGGFSASVIVVSKDGCGRVTIEAEPQQRPFFEAIPWEQLYAQVNAWLACE